jgi:hypothetical protein
VAEKPIYGWKSIAAHVGLSVKVCRQLAYRTDGGDRLPVKGLLGTSLRFAYPSALDAWLDRNGVAVHMLDRLVDATEPPPRGASGHPPLDKPRNKKRA